MFKNISDNNQCINCKIDKRWFVLTIGNILSNNIEFTIQNNIHIKLDNISTNFNEAASSIISEIKKLDIIFLDVKWVGSHLIFYITEEDFISGKIKELILTNISGIQFKQSNFEFEIYPFCGLRNQWMWTEFSISQLSYESNEDNFFEAFNIKFPTIEGTKDYDILTDNVAQSLFNLLESKIIQEWGYDEFITIYIDENIIKFAIRKDIYKYFIQDFNWFNTNNQWKSNSNLFISPTKILWKEIEAAKTEWLRITPSGLKSFELELLSINVGGFNIKDKKPFEIIHNIVNRWNDLIFNKEIIEEKDLLLKSKHIDIFVKNDKIKFLINSDFIPMGGMNNECITHAIWNNFFSIKANNWIIDESLNFDKLEECLNNYIRWGIPIPEELKEVNSRGLFINDYNLIQVDYQNIIYHLNFNGGGTYSADWTPIKILSNQPITNLNVKWNDVLLNTIPINLIDNNYFWKDTYNGIYEHFVYPEYLNEFNLSKDWKTMNPTYDNINYSDNGITWMYGGHYKTDKIWIKSELTSQNARGESFLINMSEFNLLSKEPIKWNWINKEIKSSISGLTYEFNKLNLANGQLNFIFSDNIINTSNIWINTCLLNKNLINKKFTILSSNNLNLLQSNIIFKIKELDEFNIFNLFVPENNNIIICNFLDKCFNKNTNKCNKECSEIYLKSNLSEDNYENLMKQDLSECELISNLEKLTNHTSNPIPTFPYLNFSLANENYIPEHLWNPNFDCSSLFLTTSEYKLTDGILTGFWNKPCKYPLSDDNDNFCPYTINNNKIGKNYLIQDKLLNCLILPSEIQNKIKLNFNKIIELNIDLHFWLSNWGIYLNEIGTLKYPDNQTINNPSIISLITNQENKIKNWITQEIVDIGKYNKGCETDLINDVYLNQYDWNLNCNNDFDYYFSFVLFKDQEELNTTINYTPPTEIENYLNLINYQSNNNILNLNQSQLNIKNVNNLPFDENNPLNIYTKEFEIYLNNIWSEPDTKISFNELFIKQAGNALLIWIDKNVYEKSFIKNSLFINDKDNLLINNELKFIPYSIRDKSDFYYKWEFTPYRLNNKDNVEIKFLDKTLNIEFPSNIDKDIYLSEQIIQLLKNWCWENGWFNFVYFELKDNIINFYIDKLIYLFFINRHPQLSKWSKPQSSGFLIYSPYINWTTIQSSETDWIELSFIASGNLIIDLNLFGNNINLEDYWGINISINSQNDLDNISNLYYNFTSPTLIKLIQIYRWNNKIKFKINSDLSIFNLQNINSNWYPSIKFNNKIQINNQELENINIKLDFKGGEIYNKSEIPLTIGLKLNKINLNTKNKFFSLEFNLGGINNFIIKDIQLENNIEDTILNIIRRVELDFDRENLMVYSFNWNKPKLKDNCNITDGILNISDILNESSKFNYFFFEISPSYLLNNNIWNSKLRRDFNLQTEYNANINVLGINPLYLELTNQFIYTSGRFPSLSENTHTNFYFNDSLEKEWSLKIKNLFDGIQITSKLLGNSLLNSLKFKIDANNNLFIFNKLLFDNINNKTSLWIDSLWYLQNQESEINSGVLWIDYSEKNIGLDDDKEKWFKSVYNEYYYQIAQNTILENNIGWSLNEYPINYKLEEPVYSNSLITLDIIKNKTNWDNWILIQHHHSNISNVSFFPSPYFNNLGVHIENEWIEEYKGLRWYDNQKILKVLRNEISCNKQITELCIPINNYYNDYLSNSFYINPPKKENAIWLVASFTICNNQENQKIKINGLLNNEILTGKTANETAFNINEAFKIEWNLKWNIIHTKNVSNTIFIWQNTLLSKTEGWYIDWLDISIEGNAQISHNRIEFLPEGDTPDLFNSFYLSIHNLYGIDNIDCKGKIYIDWLNYELEWTGNPINTLYKAIKEKVNEFNYGDWVSVLLENNFIILRIDSRINWIFERFIKEHNIWIYLQNNESYLSGGQNNHLSGHTSLTKFNGIPDNGKILLTWLTEEYVNGGFYLDYEKWKNIQLYELTNYYQIEHHDIIPYVNNIIPDSENLEFWNNRNKLNIIENIHNIYWNKEERKDYVTIEGGVKWNKKEIEWDKGWITHTQKLFHAHLWIIDTNINNIELLDIFISNGQKWNKNIDTTLEIRGMRLEKNNLDEFIHQLNYFFSITPDYIHWKCILIDNKIIRLETNDFYSIPPTIKTIKKRLNPPQPINSDIIIKNNICSVYNNGTCRIIIINDTLNDIINSKIYSNEEKEIIVFDNNQDSISNEVKIYFSGGVAYPNWTNWSFLDFNINKKSNILPGTKAELEIKIFNNKKQKSIKNCIQNEIDGWDKDGIPIAKYGNICPTNYEDDTYLKICFIISHKNDITATNIAIAINQSLWNNKVVARSHGSWIRLYLHPHKELNWLEQGKRLNLILNSDYLNIQNNLMSDWSIETFNNLHNEYYHQSHLKVKININLNDNKEDYSYSSLSIDHELFRLINNERYYFNFKVYPSLSKTLAELSEIINQKLAQWGRNWIVYTHYYEGRDWISLLISPKYLIDNGLSHNNGKLNDLNLNMHLINWGNINLEFIYDSECCYTLCGKDQLCPGIGCDIQIKLKNGEINSLELNEFEWEFINGVQLIKKSDLYNNFKNNNNLQSLLDTLFKTQCEQTFEICRKIEIGWNKDLFQFFNKHYNTSDWKNWILEEDWILKKDSSITFRAKDDNYLDISYVYLPNGNSNASIELETTNFNQGIVDDYFALDIINDNWNNNYTIGINEFNINIPKSKIHKIYWINKDYLAKNNELWIKIILKTSFKEEILLYLEKNINENELSFVERWIHIHNNTLLNKDIIINKLDNWVYIYSLNSDLDFDCIKKESDNKWYLLKEYTGNQTLIPTLGIHNKVNYKKFKDNRIEMEIINNPFINSFIINNRNFYFPIYSQIDKGLRNWFFINKNDLLQFGIRILFQTNIKGDINDNVQKMWLESKDEINLKIVRGFNCGNIWFKCLCIKLINITDELNINIDGVNYNTEYINEFLSIENKINLWYEDNKYFFELNNIKIKIENNQIRFWKTEPNIIYEINTGIWGGYELISDINTVDNHFIGNLKLNSFNEDQFNFNLYRFYSGSNLELDNFYFLTNNSEYKINKKDKNYLLLNWKKNVLSEHPLIIDNYIKKNLIIQNYYKLPSWGDSFDDLPVNIKIEWYNNEETNLLYDNSMFLLDLDGDNINLNSTNIQYNGELPLYSSPYLILNKDFNDLLKYNKDPKKQKLIFDNILKIIKSDDQIDINNIYNTININLGFRSNDGVYNNRLIVNWDWNRTIKFTSKDFNNKKTNIFNFIKNKIEIKNVEFINWKNEIVSDLINSGLKEGMVIKLWGRLGINKKIIFKNNAFEGKIIEIGASHIYLDKNLIDENLSKLINNNEFSEITIQILPIKIMELDLWGKSIGENEILNTMLNNMGINIKPNLQKLFKETDIKENGINWNLINEKRKEMFLASDDIWNYTGTYKSLASWINFFGWDNLILREKFIYNKENDFYDGRISNTIIHLNSGNLEYDEIYFKDKNWYKTYGLDIIYPITDNNGRWLINNNLEDDLIKLSGLKNHLVETTIPMNIKEVNLGGQLNITNNINISRNYSMVTKNNIFRKFEIVDFNPIAYKLITSNNSYNIVITPFTQSGNLDINTEYEIHIITYRESKNELNETVLSQIQEQKIRKTDLTNYNLNVNKDIDYLFEINITTWYKYEYPYSIKKNYRLIDILQI